MKQSLILDLNCDLGESPEMLADGTEAALMQCITSANVACGGHAGDARTMEASIRLALEHGVKIGAHPAYPDRKNFGRKRMQINDTDLEKSIAEQIAIFVTIAARCGAEVAHVKPHGALYHAADSDLSLTRVVGHAVRSVSANLALVGRAGAPMLQVWRDMGFKVMGEAFADRVYEADGRLRSRDLAGAVIKDPKEAALQAWTIAHEHKVIAINTAEIPIHADTICIHSDTAGAIAIAQAVQAMLAR